MKTISYTIPAELDVSSMVKLSDLIYHDGPLLSLYETIEHHQYLFYWVDRDDKSNRWLVFQTSPEAIDSYLLKQITLLDLIANSINEVCYILDITGDGVQHNTQLCAIGSLPEDYLPGDDSYYAFEKIDVDVYEV